MIREEFSNILPDSHSLPVTLAHIHETTGKKFIILIDEWDALFREAKDDAGLHREYLQLLRGLFKSSQTETYEALKLYIEMDEEGLKESGRNLSGL